MKHPKTSSLFLVFLFSDFLLSLNGQVKITDGPVLTLDPNSMIELESTNKGLLISRIAINSLILPAPLTDPVPEGMIVYSVKGVNTSDGILKVEIMLPSCKNGTLKINNIMDQALFVYKIDDPGYHEFNPILKTGIYIVTFSSDNKKFSEKILFESQ